MSTNPVIVQMLKQFGLLTGEWQELEQLDAQCHFVLENKEVLDTLPRRVVGDLTFLSSDVALVRRKTLLSFVRRLCRETEGALVRRRHQKRINRKTVSFYSYRYIT